MSWNNKVIWHEGLFLQPSHFQQQERYFQSWIESRCGNLQCYAWGITRLEIDQSLLDKGKFAVTTCQGVFPDGTPFNIPDHHPAPTPLDVPNELKDQIVYLALPIYRSTSMELAWGENSDELIRYQIKQIEVKDVHSQKTQDSTTIISGELRTKLRLSSQNQGAFVTIPIARIIERKPNKLVILDEQFIPTCMHVNASSRLNNYIQEIESKLHQQGEDIAKYLGSPSTSGIAEIVDFLLLQIVNRYEPLFTHFISLNQLHPERLFNVMIQMAGELATITRTEHRPKIFPIYNHEDLTSCFPPIAIALFEALAWRPERRAISIPLDKHPQYPIYTAIIHDRQLLQSAEFVLAVKAQTSIEKLHNDFPRQTTIANKDKLHALVRAQVPGIALSFLTAAPRQIPLHSGMTYFVLDKNNTLWQELEKSGTIAMHFSDAPTGLELEFWAIRG